VIVTADVEIATRDGIVLRGDVARPDDSIHDPVPVLLQRSPYGAQRSGTAELLGMPDTPGISLPLAIGGSGLRLDEVVAAGFAVMVVDCRGTHRSGGTFRWMATEATDGVDVVAWIKEQLWCNGRVLGFGGSYVSATQFVTALANPSSLSSISPWVALSRPDIDMAGRGGIPIYATTYNWAANRVNDARVKAGQPPREDIPLAEGIDPAPLLSQHTLPELAAVLATAAQGAHVAEWVSHPTYDDYWRLVEYPEPALRRLAVPGFHLAGWYDLFLGGTLRNFMAMRRGPARDDQHLVIGPWTHIDQMGRIETGHDFGPDSTLVGGGITALQLDFWREHGLGAQAGQLPPVRLFVMGVDEWRDYAEWPVPGTQELNLYLSDGVLAPNVTEVTGASTITHDPANPVPAVGGQILYGPPDFAGPHDQRPAEAHPGVLSFTTPPFAETFEVIGHVALRCWVSADATDADLHAVLTDVAADGTSRILTDGALRLSRRLGLDRVAPLVPGEPVEVEIDMWATANAFLPGHCLRLNLAGSSFPRYVVGEGPVTIQVHLGRAFPSHLVVSLRAASAL
jgi:putative CocE/NonD family hydrolase